jgi:hypothetical protein
MEKKRWIPCFCTIILGILVIVFARMDATWTTMGLTIIGVLVIIKGLINSCCCSSSFEKKESGSCCGDNSSDKDNNCCCG